MGIPLLIFAGALLVLVRSSGILMTSLIGLARLLRLSEYLVAFILMSFATSVSELFVGISSAVDGVPELSLGNILGANLLNLTVVIGISAFLAGGLSVESKLSRKNFWLIFFLSFLPFLLGADGIISRADGLALLVTFFIYIWHILEEREYFSKAINNHPTGTSTGRPLLHTLARFTLAIGLLIGSSYAATWSAERIATSLSFDLLSFGVLFVALGTTLPELTFGIRSAIARHGSLAVGNSLGSVAFNATFIIGLVSIVHPIAVAEHSVALLVAFAAAFILFNAFLYRNTTIARFHGLLLALIYVAFVAVEYFVL